MAHGRSLPKCIVEILPGLFLGNKHASTNYDLLKSINVKAIVNVGGGKNHFNLSEFKYMRISIIDSVDVSIFPFLEETCTFIDREIQDGAVLVHCRGGFSRSPTIIIAFLMKFQRICFEDALQMVKNKRPCCQPNRVFMDDLKKFETSLNQV